MPLVEQEFEALLAGTEYYYDLDGNPYFNVESLISQLSVCLCNDLILDFEEKYSTSESK